MLLLVYHHLGDSWKSAREASTSRLLCFTTGFPGAPKGSPLQLFPNGSNAVHRSGGMTIQHDRSRERPCGSSPESSATPKQSPILPMQCRESDSNLRSSIKPFGWLQAPAMTQIDRM